MLCSKTAIRTNKRLKLINEIIHGIQIIKMNTWEKPFTKLVEFARRYEIEQIKQSQYILGIQSSLYLIMSRISIYLTILVYVIFSNAINAVQIFVLIAFLNILKLSVSSYFVHGIRKVQQCSISINRINQFLLLEENNVELYSNTSQIFNKQFEQFSVTITDASIKWSKDAHKLALSDLNLSIKRGVLLGVVGPVGSGKSTLLYTILRETSIIKGKLKVYGKVSYASHEPWIFPGTIRQNILLGLPMDRLRYEIVLQKCDLKEDIAQLLQKDKTIVGVKGMLLNREQKEKINLARSLYRDADIYLLDDPLSAVDEQKRHKLYKDCVWNFLTGKTVILVAHQIENLTKFDNIIVLEKGKIKAQGSLSELQESKINFQEIIEDSRINTTEKLDNYSSSNKHRKKHSGNFLSAEKYEEIPKYEEVVRSASANTYSKYLFIDSSWLKIFLIAALFIITQTAGSGGDYFLSYWANQEQELWNLFKLPYSRSITENIKIISHDYKMEIFLTDTSIYVYSAFIMILIVSSLVRSFSYYAMCLRSSISLHDNLFEKISHATMKYFYLNTSNRILTRFSKDIGCIDDLLPSTMIELFTISSTIFGAIVVVSMVNPIFLIPFLVLGLFFSNLKNIYTDTSSNVRKLEAQAKSLLITHLASSVEGLSTIRAYGVQNHLKKEYENFLDQHNSVWFLHLVTARAFAFVLDLLCAVFTGIVTSSFFIMSHEQLSGSVGLAITQTLGLTGMLQWGVKRSTEMKTQMASVETILDYKTIDQETHLEKVPIELPSSWPHSGRINFIKVELTYFKNEAPVLKKLSCSLQAGEKIGIVGRAGAGKSSIIFALFRLAKIEGAIIIDDVDISRIRLDVLRSKLSIITPNPLIIPGTLRRNLDPFNQFRDEVLWKVLEEVELKDAVYETVTGLSTMMSEENKNFNTQQCQLICLARTILQNNKILILDCTTTNVDPQTNDIMRRLIMEKFSTCTVLIIAERLHTVMDFDRVMVMEEGKLVEFDHPHVLLQNSRSSFYKIVEDEGIAMLEEFQEIAKDVNYEEMYAIEERSTIVKQI